MNTLNVYLKSNVLLCDNDLKQICAMMGLTFKRGIMTATSPNSGQYVIAVQSRFSPAETEAKLDKSIWGCKIAHVTYASANPGPAVVATYREGAFTPKADLVSATDSLDLEKAEVAAIEAEIARLEREWHAAPTTGHARRDIDSKLIKLDADLRAAKRALVAARGF